MLTYSPRGGCTGQEQAKLLGSGPKGMSHSSSIYGFPVAHHTFWSATQSRNRNPILSDLTVLIVASISSCEYCLLVFPLLLSDIGYIFRPLALAVSDFTIGFSHFYANDNITTYSSN